ncbi:MAG TPA: hypothetical protein VKU02_26300 [Gemmataceae bacterium]|nr:hypothetical protein [Gemmataceae bacterium]
MLQFACCISASRVLAQPAAPPPPKEYRAEIRYRIRTVGVGRLAPYNALVRYLESIGFHKDPGPENEAEDPERTRMTGTIAPANVAKVLLEPHVQAILLVPLGYELPAETDQAVKVQLWLKSGLPLDRQRLLADQVRSLLRELGFHEAVGYDHHGHTRLVGTIPAGNVEMLLEDLRWQGSGWLAPRVPVDELPTPLRNAWPLRIVEVTPEPVGVEPAKDVPPTPEPANTRDPLLKIARDLRTLDQGQPVHMEVILVATPEDDRSWRQNLLQAAAGATIEGRLGPLVSLMALPKQAEDLARLPRVATVRLPRPAFVSVLPLEHSPKDNREALRSTGLDTLHTAGFRGQGVRVAIVGSDFRGYEQFLGKQLGARTRYVDLTAECQPSIEPKAFAGESQAMGRDTQSALAVAVAAPAAEFTLVRIDSEAPYQLQEVARSISGEPVRSDCLDLRSEELAAESSRLQQRQEQLLEQRRQVLDNFGQDEATVKRRQAYFQQQAEFDRQMQEHGRRLQRYLDLMRDLRALKGVQVVACSLVWSDGYPVDGTSPLSRSFDDRPFCAALWYQAAGDTNGQAWAGLFRDTDGNGVMEFAPPSTPLQPGRWTPELNFLSWQPIGGTRTPELPAGKLRVSIQWREPHDPTFGPDSGELYQQPLADVRLLILRQRDPTGTKLPADDMEVIARSDGLPLRLENTPSSAAYEQTVEFTVPSPGRYAVRVEGRIPATIRPANERTLPSLQKTWELRLRLFVRQIEESVRMSGRVIFGDYATDQGNPGMPGDAHAILSVGALSASGRPEGYSSFGPAFNQALRIRPDAFSFDELSLGVEPAQAAAGTGLAAGFAAGTAASALSAGMPAESVLFAIHRYPGGLLRIRPRVQLTGGH